MMDEQNLNLDLLDTRSLGLVWGLTAGRAKDGNRNLLLSQLGAVFEEEYQARTGQLTTSMQPIESVRIDFEEFGKADLTRALQHFLCLAAAFGSTGKFSSVQFCKTMSESIFSALSAYAGAGHA